MLVEARSQRIKLALEPISKYVAGASQRHAPKLKHIIPFLIRTISHVQVIRRQMIRASKTKDVAASNQIAVQPAFFSTANGCLKNLSVTIETCLIDDELIGCTDGKGLDRL